ncbi:14-3-3-like protein [Aspergillus uvarum CBS 121591]|uniref:14-3-3-like protein n=1 Tax=Aspergillus uvarum CBS 121591 TaxID=1448315 RepID=A0A319CP67_9EURO|nr:14-3-3-like protein [Aspergillus uvarum CBS 121591]PYH87165.1 14-3-3-like protein [Aspergillus uvarum CBS 121591]
MDVANTAGASLPIDTGSLVLWMASSEVDQKALGNFAATTSLENPFLSAMLYKQLGLSVMLSKKLLRARRLRRLDPTRETKSLQLYYHIVWLAREGLLILEQCVLPHVQVYVELNILAYKLRASFYHIFVLFHNQPAIHAPGIDNLPNNATFANSAAKADLANKPPELRYSFQPRSETISVSDASAAAPESALRRRFTQAPPGLAPVQPPKSISAFLLPALDYTKTATQCFEYAVLLAESVLPGSHPLRLSIKLEYAAYLYDCLHDPLACRRVAKKAIADVYNAKEAMDDESFEDAAEIVGILGKMVKRVRKASTAGSTTVAETPRDEQSRSDGSRTPSSRTTAFSRAAPSMKPTSAESLPPAVPDPTMVNPI